MLLRAYFGSIASIAELDEYTAAVDGLPGGPPLAHWRLGQPSGSFFERKAGRHATPLGTIIRNVPGLPQASDDAAYFAGTGSAEVAHDPGLELAALSLSFWVIVHSLHDSNTAVISKDQSGFVMGDFAVYLTSDNLMGVLFQDGGAQYTITAPISLGTKYHVCVRADHTGFDYYLNAQFVGKNTSFTDAWSSNTQALRLASVPWSSNLSDVTLDEICLFERVLTEAEIAQLAQRTDAPVAEPDLFNVPEESSTVLDVLANDRYLGHKSNLTVELWNGSSWTDTVSTAHGTASVRADKDIEFVAGSVDGDQSDGFQYRIRDANGHSAPGSVQLTVVDATAAGATIYVATHGSDSNPGTQAQPFRTIQHALNVATPGDIIEVAPGSYSGADWPNSGTPGNPITLRAQFPAATTAPENYTRITGNINVEHLRIQNRSHVVVDGLYFNGGSSRAITFASSSNSNLVVGGEIKNCRIEQPFNRSYSNGILVLRSGGCKIHHNVFLDLGPDVTNPVMDYAIICNTLNQNIEIYNNYFSGRFHQCISLKERCDNFRIAFNTFDGSRLTSIFMGQQDDGFQDNIDQTSMNNVVEFNHFRDMKDGSQHYPLNVVTQIKNSGNTTFRFNLIENAEVGILHQRTAHTGAYYSGGGGTVSLGDRPVNDAYYGNVFINCTVAVRALGQGYANDDVKVWNNTFYGCGRSYDADQYFTGRTDSWIETYAPPDVQFYNNNVSGSGAPAGVLNTTTWRNNNWHNSGGARHASDLTVNPQFVGTPAVHTPGPPNPVFEPNFAKVALLKLQSGSPLRGAGIEVGLGQSSPPDIGHNEFVYLTSAP